MSGSTEVVLAKNQPIPPGPEIDQDADDRVDVGDCEDDGAETLQARAWAFLRRWKLTPRPYAYEVAYLYEEGDNEEFVNRPVDEVLRRSKSLCDYDIQQIHAAMRGGAERDAWNKLKQEFANVGNIIKRQTDSSSKYSRSLRERNEEISNVTTIDQFRDIISGLVRENERILNETQDLRSELENTTHQISDLRQKLEEARDKELQDPLTRIGNRRYFDEWLEKECAAAGREGKPLCLAIADLDYFKQINDTFGHPVGDAVLCYFAQLIQSNVKGRDRIARHGGEEFAVMLPDTKLRAAVKLMDKIRRDLNARNIVIVEDQMDIGKVTASIGIAELQAGQSVEAFLKDADSKLYEAKRSGRNCVKF